MILTDRIRSTSDQVWGLQHDFIRITISLYIFRRELKLSRTKHHCSTCYVNKKSQYQQPASLQRWALILSSYNYSIYYQPGEKLANADGLSRLPLQENPKETPKPVLLMDTVQTALITVKKIKMWTDKDPIISGVKTLCQKGWMETSDDNCHHTKDERMS